MTKPDFNRTLWGAPLLLALTLAGCGHGAKDFGGSWKPVNHFQDETTAIPLKQGYTFYASPMDGTLKTMLTRWSKDTGMRLSYQLTSDFTLYQPVSKIQTKNVRAAVAQLTTIYADEGVLITVNDKQILVSVANTSKPSALENKTAPNPIAPILPATSMTSAAPSRVPITATSKKSEMQKKPASHIAPASAKP